MELRAVILLTLLVTKVQGKAASYKWTHAVKRGFSREVCTLDYIATYTVLQIAYQRTFHILDGPSALQSPEAIYNCHRPLPHPCDVSLLLYNLHLIKVTQR